MRALVELLPTFIENHGPVLYKAGVGLASITGGVTLSLSLVKEWMQIGSLAIGMAVGLATIISIIRKESKK